MRTVVGHSYIKPQDFTMDWTRSLLILSHKKRKEIKITNKVGFWTCFSLAKSGTQNGHHEQHSINIKTVDVFSHVRSISGDGKDVLLYSPGWTRSLSRDIYNRGLLSKQHRHFEKTLTRTYNLVIYHAWDNSAIFEVILNKSKKLGLCPSSLLQQKKKIPVSKPVQQKWREPTVFSIRL